jgi:hypothetical protein
MRGKLNFDLTVFDLTMFPIALAWGKIDPVDTDPVHAGIPAGGIGAAALPR